MLLAATVGSAANAATSSLDQQFQETVKPFVTKYCIGCHSGAMPAAQFDLKSYTTLGFSGRRLSPLGTINGKTFGEGNAAQAHARPAGRGTPTGNRVGSSVARPADKEICGRSGSWSWRAD